MPSDEVPPMPSPSGTHVPLAPTGTNTGGAPIADFANASKPSVPVVQRVPKHRWSATDLAVVRVQPDGLSAVKVGDSDALVHGQEVLTIGSVAFSAGTTDFRNNITRGIVSGLHRRWPHFVLQVVGCGAGFFVAAYTGALLTATNQPMWSDTAWLAPLFLASAASTSLAAMALIARWKNVGTPEARARLEGAEPLALGLELVVLGAFVASLGDNLGPVLQTVRGNLDALDADV